jgi:hypothetical protein
MWNVDTRYSHAHGEQTLRDPADQDQIGGNPGPIGQGARGAQRSDQPSSDDAGAPEDESASSVAVLHPADEIGLPASARAPVRVNCRRQ